MPILAEKYPGMIETRYLGPARVLEVNEDESQVRLCLQGPGEEGDVWAHMAIPGSHELTPGDTVLVIGEDLGDLYVIGLLNRKEAPAISSKKLALSSGAYAEVAGPPRAQTLQMFSRKNELLFEYDEANGRARVNIESGNLEFVTHNGDIAFLSGREILFHGQSVGISSPSGIRLGIMDAIGKIHSSLTLQPNGIKLNSPEIGVSAQRGDFQVEETTYTSRNLLAKITYVKLILERIETTAQSVIEKAKNVYKTVEQLSQLKAGRMRTLVDSTFHFKTKKAFIKSEEDYKIKADKIHLG